MQIIEILIILTICIVFIVYTQLYTIEFYEIKLFISISPSNNYNSICYFFRNFAALYPLETYIII